MTDKGRMRLAAGTLLGCFVLFLVAMFLYFMEDESPAASKIFDTVKTVVAPMATLILGYFFGRAADGAVGTKRSDG